ncbi:MAG: hypothetical protein ACP5QT_07365 [Brevinematia bacterium]
MKWQNILIFAILLSFSPFYIFTGSFLFHYSMLGYGLALVSFYYKRELKKIDVLIIASLILVLFYGFMNKFEWYGFFAFVFYFLLVVMVYLSCSDNVIKIISHIFVFIAGMAFPFRYLFINFPVLIRYFVFLDYIFGIFSIIFLILDQNISIRLAKKRDTRTKDI